ncbi:molybdenum cofactor biosynthesis protein MoaE [Altererythrobacter ishigakiensis]|uniref:Molybdopterin synthase catalytic subunit n=1 Tax=Altererythrobacter ishigakiensis TaxID=476157 RepID=A0A562UVI7_9SPHN|nr:molybdenum cofactor biosynthesis protein MoaE [Altererythrobacter ishigakiensis]TWJ09652.1 molybdopterin synthase subunit MoaE [Altererythrobacter ishigakiensis]
MRDVRLLAEAFDPSALVDQFKAANSGLGGVCTFVGEVRSETGVEALELSHYEPLTLPSMDQLADAAFARFELMGLLMVHRVGQMLPGDPIVCVSAAARHRRGAIDAVDFCMDHLKAAAWFWKRERRDGEWQWIEPRSDDYADLARWS